MGESGGIKLIKLKFKTIWVLFTFPCLPHGLTKLNIAHVAEDVPFYRFTDLSTDITILPPTITDLKLNCVNVLDFFFNREKLAVTVQKAEKPIGYCN